jgi:hypothetical protein
MIDYFKVRGVLMNCFPDELCLKHSVDLSVNPILKRLRIPNESETEFLELTYLIKKPHLIRIEGNLRKWWYSKKNAVSDLNKTSLNKCVKLISQRLSVNESEIWKLEFFYLELGGNIKLESKYSTFIPSIVEFPRLELERFSNKSVTFSGEKYSIIFYNKIIELSDRGIISTKTAKRLLEKIFILRFEIKIGAKSGYKHLSKLRTFLSVKNNFDFLVDDWLEMFYKVKIIDLFSGVKEINKDSITPKEFIHYMAFQKMRDTGIDYALYLSNNFVKNRKSQSRNKLLEIHKEFSDGVKWHYYTHIASTVALKAGQFKT